jgi:uncharacterized membrane protein SirB2
MTILETIWIAIAIGGFLLFIEGGITYIARLIRCIPEDCLKMIGGIILFTLAIIVNLKNYPPWLYGVVLGLSLLLILAIVILMNFSKREKRRGKRSV